MKEADRNALFAILASVLLGLGIAIAGSQGGARVAGLPLFGLSVALAYIIQWLAFIPAYRLQTERFFDLTGSLTYITITLITLVLSPVVDGRSILLAALVVIWAARLGTFLFRRIRKEGKDGRFDELKPSFVRFLSVWTIQGLWVTLTLAAAQIALTSTNREDLGAFAVVGAILWAGGFAVEVVADYQKSKFRQDPANRGEFIQSGLWSISRHPNYVGEIFLWIGVAIIAVPVFEGWQWVGLISPLFVYVLLNRVSGVPMLERRADEKWGDRPDYQAYKQRTPVLFPRLGR